MTSFAIGLSALRVNQRALQAVSHNIANAGTEGFHRRSIRLKTVEQPFLPSNNTIPTGRGVSIGSISAIRDSAVEGTLTRTIGEQANVNQSLVYERRIENIIAQTDNSIADKVSIVFRELQLLSSEPNSTTRKQSAINAVADLATTIRDSSSQLTSMRQQIEYELAEEVNNGNKLMTQLIDPNKKIRQLELQGSDAPDERDQRDVIVNDLAESVGLNRSLNLDESAFRIQNTTFQLSTDTIEIESRRNSDGTFSMLFSDKEKSDVGGRAGAMLQALNTSIPDYLNKLEELTQDIIRSFDSVHARGIGAHGSFSALNSTRAVRSPNTPLAFADPAIEITSGEFTLSVIDGSGQRSVSKIAIDPNTDSLQDVVDRINLVTGVSASIDPNQNTLQIRGIGDNKFDFTSGVASTPNFITYTGTATPTLSGAYTGSNNDDITFRIEGSGDIGVSSDLYVSVFEPNGSRIARVNIGAGYENDTPLDIGDGIQLSFSSGTVVASDEFSVARTGTPDETGFLAATGFNSLFSGDGAGGLKIRDDIANDPNLLAIGDSGNSADTANLVRILALQEARSPANNLTISELSLNISSSIGFEVQNTTNESVQLTNVRAQLEQERDSVSGVDLNEELVFLQNFQRSYEAAARIVQAMDNIFEELVNILR